MGLESSVQLEKDSTGHIQQLDMSVLQSLCEWGDQKCQQLWNKHWP